MDGEMSIKGYVDSAEVEAKLGRSDNKAFIEKVFRGMKENPGKYPDLDIGVKTFAAAQKKVRLLNNLRYKMSSEYAKIVLILTGKNDNDFNVYAIECEPAKKKNGKKKGAAARAGKQAKKQQADVLPGQWQAMSAEEKKKQLLKAVEAMPPRALPVFLAQQQTALTVKQSELAAPGLKEDAAAKIKEEIQMYQEVIEAIKKRMGN